MSGRGRGTVRRPPPPSPALTRRRSEEERRARAEAAAPTSDEKDKDEKDEIIARANAEVERLTKLLRQATDEVDQLKQTVDDMTTVESELRDYIAAMRHGTASNASFAFDSTSSLVDARLAAELRAAAPRAFGGDAKAS